MPKLSSLGELRTGFQLRGAAKHQPGGVNTIVQLGDVRDDGINLSGLIQMNLDSKRVREYLAPGDILLRGRGASYRATLVQGCPPGTVATAPLYLFRTTSPEVLPEYLVWFINRPATQGLLAGRAHGTYIPTVSIDAFSELEVILPPLHEQSRIAEIDALTRQERELSARLSAERERLAQTLLERLLPPHKDRE